MPQTNIAASRSKHITRQITALNVASGRGTGRSCSANANTLLTTCQDQRIVPENLCDVTKGTEVTVIGIILSIPNSQTKSSYFCRGCKLCVHSESLMKCTKAANLKETSENEYEVGTRRTRFPVRIIFTAALHPIITPPYSLPTSGSIPNIDRGD